MVLLNDMVQILVRRNSVSTFNASITPSTTQSKLTAHDDEHQGLILNVSHDSLKRDLDQCSPGVKAFFAALSLQVADKGAADAYVKMAIESIAIAVDVGRWDIA
ncbi:hypothetical protein H6F88_02070 [Oculatella sp. FACHB-28]|uniref:hypothetical protein n=1 Tax=Oculatella sp. FACHB-28 TaxID=2692845 RepID=UPI0016823363|nr:hypothetical protein [Oculatella sp. FACHB-28]MBD2054821.1 hypothetical protein [Oculatella sp. FACHB-28]